MRGYLTFLGTGGSVGVPIIGCQCAVCLSKNPFNQRLRPSVLIRLGDQQFLIDVGPDFRFQALHYGITHLEGLLLTHAHYDHTAGMDDLRPIYYQRKAPLPILLSSATAEDVQRRYDYLFEPSLEPQNFVQRFQLQFLPHHPQGVIQFEGLNIRYVTYTQGGMLVNGFCIGNLAYLSDIRHFSPSIFKDLEEVKYLIISALRYTPSQLHFSVDEAIDFVKQLQVEQAWLTHLSHELDYHLTNAYLPENIRLAYDGLEIEFESF